MDKIFFQEIDKNQLIDMKICPICSGASKTVDKVCTMNEKSKDMLDLRECLSCGHWWNNPLPQQKYLSSLYENSSEFVVPLGYAGTSATEECILKEKNPIIKSILKKNNFNYLEIGAGSGNQFAFFKKITNLCYAVEPGRWHAGDQNIFSDIDKIPNNVKFDVIMAKDVIEHLSDPLDMMKKLNQLANKGAIVYCCFPNKDCLKANLLKGGWSMIRPLGHLHYFSSLSVKIMFKKSGWKNIYQKNGRIVNATAIDIIKNFDYHGKNLLYRLFKSLLVGQLLLGKDQWTAVGIAD